MTNLEELIAEVQADHRAHWKKKQILVEHNGVPMSLRELAEIAGLAHSTVSYRYRKGLRGADLIVPADPKRIRHGKWE